MRYNRNSFLLIELLIVLFLVTLLITLFLGGQAHLFRMQAQATRQLQAVNELLVVREHLCSGETANFGLIQIEKHVLSRPTITGDDAGSPEQWLGKVQCLVCRKRENADSPLTTYLPWIGYVRGNDAL